MVDENAMESCSSTQNTLLPPLQDKGIEDYLTERTDQNDWLWQGLLAPGQITMLTAMWKTGKTTLITGLLAKLKAGGDYCGQPVRSGRALIVSEETPDIWVNRARQLDLSPQVRLLCRPFPGRPSLDEWNGLLQHIETMKQQTGLDLVIIDTLASFNPYRSENNAANMVDFLVSMKRLAGLGMSVLLKHHPRKHESPTGLSARGTGALPAAIDIVLEMHLMGRYEDQDRRRLLIGLSRYEETPRRLIVELDTTRHEYIKSPQQKVDDFASGGWTVLRVVLEDAYEKLTRQRILKAWPPDFPKPQAALLWRWLDRAVADGLVLRDGLGRSKHPFRYWLPGAEERWIDRGFYLPDLEPLDPLPDDAEETAKKLAELGRMYFGAGGKTESKSP